MSEFKIIKRRALADVAGAQPAEIILCELPGNEPTPRVTWQRNDPDRGGDGSRYWGHYFSSQEIGTRADEADFLTRGR